MESFVGFPSTSLTDIVFPFLWYRRLISNAMSQGEDFLQKFVNHEKKGVPAGAGKDDKGGFDMVRLFCSIERLYSQYHE